MPFQWVRWIFSGWAGVSDRPSGKCAYTGSWSNILANSRFGSVISEAGQAYTWYENAHEYRLTPWENDPVSDRSGEAFYLRDEESGECWSPTVYLFADTVIT